MSQTGSLLKRRIALLAQLCCICLSLPANSAECTEKDALEAFRAFSAPIPNESLSLYGLKPGERELASVAVPLPLLALEIPKRQPNLKFSDIATVTRATSEVFYLVESRGHIIGIVAMDSRERQCRPLAFGYAQLGRQLDSIRDELKADNRAALLVFPQNGEFFLRLSRLDSGELLEIGNPAASSKLAGHRVAPISEIVARLRLEPSRSSKATQ